MFHLASENCGVATREIELFAAAESVVQMQLHRLPPDLGNLGKTWISSTACAETPAATSKIAATEVPPRGCAAATHDWNYSIPGQDGEEAS
jgi:hypothetical protein